jgi:phosphocarrier protein HPr
MPASSEPAYEQDAREEHGTTHEQAITLTGDLHARPAGALAVAAGQFAATIAVTAGARTVDAKSVLGVMGLGATAGQRVTVSADGPDAEAAVAALMTVLAEATRVGGLRERAASGSAGHRPMPYRPAAMNAFNQTMVNEFRDHWHRGNGY